MIKKINRREFTVYILTVFLVVVTTGFMYLTSDIRGHVSDMMYHVLRIEAVKEALLAGEYPTRINPLFFSGYGYGSSLFYPDIFLIIPALFRIFGMSPMMTWKVNIMLLAALGSTTTYFSFRYILRNYYYAAAGTLLLMLSQFYVADIAQRSGMSEYTAFIFLPILLAGIYDFAAQDGKKVYLLGIAFVGLMLSHVIMTVVGLVITVITFLVMFLHPKVRKNMLQRRKIVGLIVTALLSVMVVAYYVFPMLEQMMHDEFLYTVPWAMIGQYTQPYGVFFYAVGYFSYEAYIGVGVPVMLVFGARGVCGSPKNKWSDFFLVGGGVILLSMTDLLPWDRLQNTFLNMLQFTFRLYPYGLCFLILGLMLYLTYNCKEKEWKVLTYIAILSVFFGAWQNYYCVNLDEEQIFTITEETVLADTGFVGRAEWLPIGALPYLQKEDITRNVVWSEGEIAFCKEDYNEYSFERTTKDAATYRVPLVYYKGYQAELTDASGHKTKLCLESTEDGFVQVSADEGMQGTVRVWYAGTLVQSISNVVSVCAILVCAAIVVLRKKKRREPVTVKN